MAQLTKQDALNVLLNPQSTTQPVGTLTVNDLWGIASVAGGTGFAIAVAEVLDNATWMKQPLWQRVIFTAVVAFISILIVTVLIRTFRRALNIVRDEFFPLARSDQRDL